MALALEAPYVTADDYRNAGEGFDLTGITDNELVAILRRASRHVDAYTGQSFNLRQVIERHSWNQSTRRVYPYSNPVVSVDAARIGSGSSQDVRIYVGNQQYARIDHGDCFISNEQGWIEFLSLTTIYSISPALISLGLHTPVVEMIMTVGYGVSVTGDTGVVDSHNNKKYTFSNKLWTTTSQSQVSEFRKNAVLVYDNGVLVSEANYTIDAVDGQVIFKTTPTGPVTASYSYSDVPENVQWGTVAVATELLGERMLTQNQLTGLQSASWSGLSMSRRQHEPSWPITDRAKAFLDKYVSIALR